MGRALTRPARRHGARASAATPKPTALRHLAQDRPLSRAPGDPQAALGNERVTVVVDIAGGPIRQGLLDISQPGRRNTCSGAISESSGGRDLRPLQLRDLTFTSPTCTPRSIVRNMLRSIDLRRDPTPARRNLRAH